MDIAQKTAIITGSASGIGRASAVMLAANGAAEIALEQGGRWFTVADQQAVTSANGSMGFVASFPSGAAVVTLLPAEAPNAIDAVIVIRETDAAAKGKLSPAARRRLAELQ